MVLRESGQRRDSSIVAAATAVFIAVIFVNKCTMNDNTVRPELVWIDGRCYRFCDSGVWSEERGKAAYEEESTYAENDYNSDDDSAGDEIDVQLDRGKYKHSFYVDKRFFPLLVGTKGSTRKRLEIETSTLIQIPKMGQDGNIVISGSNRKKVILARKRLDNLISSSRKKLDYTHFISIPANSESIQNAFEKFKKSVLEMDKPIRGVEESIFQNPKKFHITFGMMVLVDDAEKREAVRALEHCKENIIAPIISEYGPVLINLQGIDYMNDDPAEVNVLYAKVHSQNDILQSIADKMSQYFSEIGIIRNDTGKVKLHATLMNTRFKYTDDERRGKKRATFDATEILKIHRNTKFGEFILDTIHISQRHTVSSIGYYEITGQISTSVANIAAQTTKTLIDS